MKRAPPPPTLEYEFEEYLTDQGYTQNETDERWTKANPVKIMRTGARDIDEDNLEGLQRIGMKPERKVVRVYRKTTEEEQELFEKFGVEH